MMIGRLLRLLPTDRRFRRRLLGIYGVLALLNLGGWAWAIALFHDRPALLAVAVVVYGLGLRHAVDADHIAAIDNVTRKLMQERQQPVTVGFWFAIGHSAVVILVTLAVVTAASSLQGFERFRDVGGTISTSISALFLFAVASMNFVILCSIIRALRTVRSGGRVDDDAFDLLMASGPLARLFRPLFRLISRSWHMAPLGFLFGLGFDTATEVALFGLASAQAAHGASIQAALVFPVLFAAGMSLLDTTDGVLMVGAYRWAFVHPLRKLYYNMTITLMSIAVALFIGGVEVIALATHRIGLRGPIANVALALNENFNGLGFAIIGVFAAAWAVSFLIYRSIERAPVTAMGQASAMPVP